MTDLDREDDVLIGPAKDVLDEKDKVEPQREEQEPETQQVEPQVTPRRRVLRSLDVPQLIALFQASEDSGSWNEEARLELLELIREKGGPGAVRRALGRLLATGDGRVAPPRAAAGSDPPAGQGGASGAAPRPCTRWCWQGPRLRLNPGEQRIQFAEVLGALARRGQPLLRLTAAAVGVELGDGRRRRLSLHEPEGLSESALIGLLRAWSDGSRSSWVAAVHGIQAVGQVLVPDTGEPGEGLVAGWVPGVAPSDAHAPGGTAVLLRLADLFGQGRLDIELVLQGEPLCAGPAAERNAGRLAELAARLGQGLQRLEA